MTYELVYQSKLRPLKFGRRLHPDLKLPHGYDVVRNPETGIRHVRTPNGYLIANRIKFRSAKRPTDWELLENFRNDCRITHQNWRGDQTVHVEVKYSRAGNPCVFTFIRYNDDRENVRITCDKDPALIIYITKNNGSYSVTTSRRRAEGGPIPGVVGQGYSTQFAAFRAAMKQTWGF